MPGEIEESWYHLTSFQRDLIHAIYAIGASDEDCYGLEIKRRLETMYRSEINHGRLYPNLDDLCEMGYLEKSQLDKRTNEYRLTEDAKDALTALDRHYDELYGRSVG
ncbi:PadR family transcriptional regulator [Haloparvum alkalitolerans]|uniref:PadR family transcriptional regulator n=1 Tax=Haloparvum alkalitolerans TaxID=1042953 RepID=UPI003CF60387